MSRSRLPLQNLSRACHLKPKYIYSDSCAKLGIVLCTLTDALSIINCVLKIYVVSFDGQNVWRCFFKKFEHHNEYEMSKGTDICIQQLSRYIQDGEYRIEDGITFRFMHERENLVMRIVKKCNDNIYYDDIIFTQCNHEDIDYMCAIPKTIVEEIEGDADSEGDDGKSHIDNSRIDDPRIDNSRIDDPEVNNLCINDKSLIDNELSDNESVINKLNHASTYDDALVGYHMETNSAHTSINRHYGSINETTDEDVSASEHNENGSCWNIFHIITLVFSYFLIMIIIAAKYMH